MLNLNASPFRILAGAALVAWGASGCATTQGPISPMDPGMQPGASKGQVSSYARALLLIDIANGALLEGDPTGALIHLEQAEREDDSVAELYHTKALAYYVKKEYALALKAGEKAVKLRPNYSDALNTLGKIRIDAGQPDAAIAPLKLAAEDHLYPDAYKALTNLGMIYYRKNDLKSAEQFFEKATLSSSDRACIAYYYLGHIQLKRKQIGLAERNYERASKKQCAGFVDAHYALGITYEQARKFDLARRKFVEIQSKYPNTAFADQAVARLKNLP